MPTAIEKDALISLRDRATRLRIHSVRATTAAGSGHPTSCASAAEIMSALFFAVMRYDPKNPADPANDVFVLSKGHAAPVLYAAWAEAGYLDVDDLLTLRRIDSDLEGHPPSVRELERVRARTGLPRDAFRFLLAHAEIDPHHAAELFGLLDELPLSPAQSSLVGLSALHTVGGVSGVFAELIARADAGEAA